MLLICRHSLKFSTKRQTPNPQVFHIIILIDFKLIFLEAFHEERNSNKSQFHFFFLFFIFTVLAGLFYVLLFIVCFYSLNDISFGM